MEVRKEKYKQKIYQVPEIKVSVEEDERTRGRQQEVEVEKWAAVSRSNIHLLHSVQRAGTPQRAEGGSCGAP